MKEDPQHREAEVGDDWYATAFGPLYPVIYAHRTVEAAVPESEFAARQVRLSMGDAALDLCCGNGRHLVTLFGHCPHFTGLDYSPHLLRIAREALGPGARLVRGDMRALPFVDAFDVVFNFFTSFGYFTTRAQNLGVARGMARALKAGGRFFLDHLNPVYVEATLVPHSQREAGGYLIREERWIDAETQRVNKIVLVTRDGNVVAQTAESVRLYTFEELSALLREAGLEIDRIFGDYGGEAFQDTCPRMIVIGQRMRKDG